MHVLQERAEAPPGLRRPVERCFSQAAVSPESPCFASSPAHVLARLPQLPLPSARVTPDWVGLPCPRCLSELRRQPGLGLPCGRATRRTVGPRGVARHPPHPRRVQGRCSSGAETPFTSLAWA